MGGGYHAIPTCARKHDCPLGTAKNGETIGGECFKDAIFEMAEVWTVRASAFMYSTFLRELFAHIADGHPPNSYFWKEDDQIAFSDELGTVDLPEPIEPPQVSLRTEEPQAEPKPRLCVILPPRAQHVKSPPPAEPAKLSPNAMFGLAAWKRVIGASPATRPSSRGSVSQEGGRRPSFPSVGVIGPSPATSRPSSRGGVSQGGARRPSFTSVGGVPTPLRPTPAGKS